MSMSNTEKTVKDIRQKTRRKFSTEEKIRIVLDGLQGPLVTQGNAFNGAMPGHRTFLDDQQIADVLSYVRSAWSNKASDITPAAVASQRAATNDRDKPWSPAELKLDADDSQAP